MTTGSLAASEMDRKVFAARSKWWNSTGGGSSTRQIAGVVQTGSNGRGNGAIKAGDGGKKFREEWPELDEENWKWLEANKIDTATGRSLAQNCSPEAAALGRRPQGSGTGVGAVVQGGQAAREEAQGWVGRYKWHVVIASVFTYVILARILGEAK